MNVFGESKEENFYGSRLGRIRHCIEFFGNLHADGFCRRLGGYPWHWNRRCTGGTAERAGEELFEPAQFYAGRTGVLAAIVSGTDRDQR